MTVTPQTNIDLPALAQRLSACDDVVICGHVGPDGDCVGSQLALMHGLRLLGKQAACVLVKDEPLDETLSWLPGAGEMVPAARYEGAARVFIGVDVPTRERVGEAACALRDRAALAVTIDHHAVEGAMADLVYVDPDAASTTMLIWELLGFMGARCPEAALCAYTGLVTDTGCFQFQNADAAALAAAADMVSAGAEASLVARRVFQNRSLPSARLEALAVSRMRLGADGAYAISWLGQGDFEREGACKADAEPIVNALRALRGVRVACMLRDQGEAVRGSLRAKDGTDVARIARLFGGGGHRAAAGLTLEMPLAQAVETMERVLARELAPSEGAEAGSGSPEAAGRRCLPWE